MGLNAECLFIYSRCNCISVVGSCGYLQGLVARVCFFEFFPVWFVPESMMFLLGTWSEFMGLMFLARCEG